MSPLSSTEIRKMWTNFWISESVNHKLAEPCSLIPDSSDKTVMFNTSGMQQFVPYLTGKAHPLGKRLYNIQPCLRTNDIEDIGDERHLSMFEMMGNRSLGDYFKKEALTRSLDFVTKQLEIPIERIGVTVFGGVPDGSQDIPYDQEAKDIRLSLGIPEHRIKAIPLVDGESDNFWGPPGAVGPCGPCSEIYVDRGDAYGPADRDMGVNDRYTEIWNNVFMEFYKDEQANFSKLSQQNVDTGMGFERLMMVLQGKETIFETDVFASIFSAIQQVSGQTYPAYHKLEAEYTDHERATVKSMRIICDHMRASSFLVAQGVIPSNEGRGYILRRLIRRAFSHLQRICTSTASKLHPSHLTSTVSDVVVGMMQGFGEIYPVLKQRETVIIQTLTQEMLNFQETIAKGEQKLTALFDKNTSGRISGADAFLLYESFGLPIEMTVEFAGERGLEVDVQGFRQEMSLAQERSRAGSSKMFAKGVDRAAYLEGIDKTAFIGYDQLETSDCKVLKDFVLDNGQRVIILDKTVFYAESGGQKGDQGTMTLDSGEVVHIRDTIKYAGVVLHLVGRSEEG